MKIENRNLLFAQFLLSQNSEKSIETSVNIRAGIAQLCRFPPLECGNIKKSLFLHVFPAHTLTLGTPEKPMTSVKFYSIYLSSCLPPPVRNVRVETTNGGDFGFLWISIDHGEMLLISTYHLMMFLH